MKVHILNKRTRDMRLYKCQTCGKIFDSVNDFRKRRREECIDGSGPEEGVGVREPRNPNPPTLESSAEVVYAGVR